MAIIYSTNQDFTFDDDSEEEPETLPPSAQKLVLRYETKQRAGKPVTIISGFVGKDDDLQDLGKTLKNKCGVGGSVKDGEIILQGDQREKIRKFLVENQYKVKG